MNNDNRNGKEVHKGQMPDNFQKEGRPKPANRMRKKGNPVAKDVIPSEPKKIPLNLNKNTGNPKKSAHKGHVIKLEDKENRTHPVDTPHRENTRSNTKPQSSSNHKKTFTVPSPEFRLTTEKTQSGRSDREDFQLFKNASIWLLIVAAILFVTWAIMFFYYKIGGNSHMILALAVICAIVSVVGTRKK